MIGLCVFERWWNGGWDWFEENKILDLVLSFAMYYMCYFGADGKLVVWEVYLVQRSYIYARFGWFGFV